MKSTFLLYLIPLLLDTVSAAPVKFSGASNTGVTYHEEAATLPPVNIGRRNALYEDYSALERRAGGRRSATSSQKQDAADVLKKKGKGDGDDPDKPGGPSKPKDKDTPEEIAKREQRRKEKEARKQEWEELQKKKNDADNNLSSSSKQDRDDAVNDEKAQAKKKKEDTREVAIITAAQITPKQYDDYMDWFASKPGGQDGAGAVKAADIAKAFEDCLPDRTDKFIFWSSGRDQAFEDGAIPRYEQLSKRMTLATATKRCTSGKGNKKVPPVYRKSIKSLFERWLETIDLKDDPKYKGKKVQLSPDKLSHEAIDFQLNRLRWWPRISIGFAKASKGEIHYVRPERDASDTSFVDLPDTIWTLHERPEIAKLQLTGVVTKLEEYTFPKGLGSKAAYAALDPQGPRDMTI